jgi:hypothetical protein
MQGADMQALLTCESLVNQYSRLPAQICETQAGARISGAHVLEAPAVLALAEQVATRTVDTGDASAPSGTPLDFLWLCLSILQWKTLCMDSLTHILQTLTC